MGGGFFCLRGYDIKGDPAGAGDMENPMQSANTELAGAHTSQAKARCVALAHVVPAATHPQGIGSGRHTGAWLLCPNGMIPTFVRWFCHRFMESMTLTVMAQCNIPHTALYARAYVSVCAFLPQARRPACAPRSARPQQAASISL